MKPTFREILNDHPSGIYTLLFKNCTLYNIPAKNVDADIRKEWFSYCPSYKIEVVYDDGTTKFEHITAKFYR